MRYLPVVLGLAGCQLVFPPEDLTVRRDIAIDQPSPETVTDFPVSILITGDPDLSRASEDGSDLRFVDADGAPLEFELVAFDGTAGDLEAWVRIPALPPEPLTIGMAYGDHVRVDHDPAATWPAPFAAVWHMNDAGGARDSTVFDRRAEGMNEPGSAGGGIVGGARDYTFDGNDPQQMCVTQISDLDFGTASFSVSLWVFVSASQGQFDMPFYKGGQLAGDPGFDFELGTETWGTDLATADKSTILQLATESAAKGHWAQLVGVVDRVSSPPRFRAFFDGAMTDQDDITGFGSVSGKPTCLGGTQAFVGLLDEVRIYDGALTPGWVAAEHENLVNRDRFVTIGPPR